MPTSAYVFGRLHKIFGYLAIASYVLLIVTQLAEHGPAYSTVYWATLSLNVVVTGLMLYAGIRLLRKKRNGVTWSNRYAWASIAATVVETLLGSFFPAHSAQASNLARLTTLLVFCSALIYPVLALVYLKQPRVKDWVESLPD